MKTLFLIVSSFLFCQVSFSQAEIKFDTTNFNLGVITESSTTYKKDIFFTNVGNEYLVIDRASTGDGGSYATWEREPILPGKRGKITFFYDIKRIGFFTKSIYINSNARSGSSNVQIKGEVVRKKTTIQVSQTKFDLGTIPFDSIVRFQFYVKNSGKENLHFIFNSYTNYDIDLLSLKMEQVNDSTKKFRYDSYTLPNDSLLIQGQMINVFGNTGDFKRELVFVYNSHDSLKIQIKGSYRCTKAESHLNISSYYGGYQKYIYQNNKLQKINDFNSDESLRKEYFFEESYCTKIVTYRKTWKAHQIENEQFFNNGKFLAEKKHPTD